MSMALLDCEGSGEESETSSTSEAAFILGSNTSNQRSIAGREAGETPTPTSMLLQTGPNTTQDGVS